MGLCPTLDFCSATVYADNPQRKVIIMSIENASEVAQTSDTIKVTLSRVYEFKVSELRDIHSERSKPLTGAELIEAAEKYAMGLCEDEMGMFEAADFVSPKAEFLTGEDDDFQTVMGLEAQLKEIADGFQMDKGLLIETLIESMDVAVSREAIWRIQKLSETASVDSVSPDAEAVRQQKKDEQLTNAAIKIRDLLRNELLVDEGTSQDIRVFWSIYDTLLEHF